MVESLYLEKCRPPSLEAYLTSMDQQSWFFGYATGLAALVTEQPPDELKRAEEVGRLAYRYGQLQLDLVQAGEDTPENWNVLHFVERSRALELAAGWRTKLWALVDDLPERPRLMLRGPFSLDLSAVAGGPAG